MSVSLLAASPLACFLNDLLLKHEQREQALFSLTADSAISHQTTLQQRSHVRPRRIPRIRRQRSGRSYCCRSSDENADKKTCRWEGLKQPKPISSCNIPAFKGAMSEPSEVPERFISPGGGALQKSKLGSSKDDSHALQPKLGQRSMMIKSNSCSNVNAVPMCPKQLQRMKSPVVFSEKTFIKKPSSSSTQTTQSPVTEPLHIQPLSPSKTPSNNININNELQLLTPTTTPNTSNRRDLLVKSHSISTFTGMPRQPQRKHSPRQQLRKEEKCNSAPALNLLAIAQGKSRVGTSSKNEQWSCQSPCDTKNEQWGEAPHGAAAAGISNLTSNILLNKLYNKNTNIKMTQPPNSLPKQSTTNNEQWNYVSPKASATAGSLLHRSSSQQAPKQTASIKSSVSSNLSPTDSGNLSSKFLMQQQFVKDENKKDIPSLPPKSATITNPTSKSVASAFPISFSAATAPSMTAEQSSAIDALLSLFMMHRIAINIFEQKLLSSAASPVSTSTKRQQQ